MSVLTTVVAMIALFAEEEAEFDPASVSPDAPTRASPGSSRHRRETVTPTVMSTAVMTTACTAVTTSRRRTAGHSSGASKRKPTPRMVVM